MQLIRGINIEKYIEALGQFRIEIFQEYPYLYEGDLDYEKKYLSRYSRSPESMLAMIHDAQGMLGACTAIPLSDEDQDFKKPFEKDNLDEIFYIGEVMIRADSRGKGVGTNLLLNIMGLIDTSQYKKICLYTVERDPHHPLCPTNYRSPDSLWRRLGFMKDPDRVVYYHWKDIGEEVETQKPMNVWLKAT
ncbi:MAG: hypothetical protein VKJ24_10060 [Synechococcales bacterium]|nr:hypothetical protein [Synechococcales bacterium]